MPDQIEKVLEIIKTKGPVLPIQIVKEIGGNTFFAGAILSQLVDEKKVFLSHTKIGGSPVYYVKGQEWRLQELYKYLNEKDKRTFDLLKQKLILRDSALDPLTRVSLRNIKDFAIPLEVIREDKKEIFWKWYLLSDEEAKKLIGEELRRLEPEKQNIVKETKNETIEREEKEEIKQLAEKREEEIEKKEKKEIKIEEKDDFFEKIRKFFKDKNIEIVDINVIKKNTEIDFIIKIPSSVGSLEYYCKAKNKKKVSDADLTSVYVKSQVKKMPAIFVSTGELTKRAKELLGKEIKLKFLKI